MRGNRRVMPTIELEVIRDGIMAREEITYPFCCMCGEWLDTDDDDVCVECEEEIRDASA